MNHRELLDTGFIFSILIGLPLSFYIGFKVNIHYELIKIDSIYYFKKIFYGHISLGLLCSLIFLVIVALIMQKLDTKLEEMELLRTNLGKD